MSGIGIHPVRLTLLAGSLAVATAAAAQQGAHLSDAQIEANVLRALAGAPELSTQNIQSSTVYGTVTLTGNVHDEAMRTRAEDLVSRASGVKKVVDEMTLGDTPAATEDASNTPQPESQPERQRDSPSAHQQPIQQPQPGDNNQPPDDGNLAPADQATGNQPPPSQDAPYSTQQQPGYSTQQPSRSNQPGSYPPPNQQPYGQQQAEQPYGPPQGQYPNQQPYPSQQYPNQAQQYPGQPQGQYPPQYPGEAQQYPNQQQPYPNQQYPNQAQQYPNQQQPYPGQPGPNQQPYGPPARRPMYPGYPPQGYYPPQQGGQPAGLEVTVPAGSMLRIRINRGLDSNHIQPGATFDGTILSDISAGGAIAIPRGATVQGTVVAAKAAGTLKGQGELGLQINSVSLGGNLYPITTEVWQREGRDKSTTTVNSALGVGALGAIIGGIAGGGAGAAVGAGVGAGVGVAGAAGSPSGRVVIPPEAVLSFRIAEPAVVRTVSQQEMARLAYAAGQPYGQQPPPPPPMRRYYSPYYGPYYAPYPYPR